MAMSSELGLNFQWSYIMHMRVKRMDHPCRRVSSRLCFLECSQGLGVRSRARTYPLHLKEGWGSRRRRRERKQQEEKLQVWWTTDCTNATESHFSVKKFKKESKKIKTIKEFRVHSRIILDINLFRWETRSCWLTYLHFPACLLT